MGLLDKMTRSSTEWMLSFKESVRSFGEGHKSHTMSHAFGLVISLYKDALSPGPLIFFRALFVRGPSLDAFPETF